MPPPSRTKIRRIASVGIGLDGKADDVRHFRKSGIEDPEMVLESPVAVKIKGGPYLPGDLLDRDLFAEEGSC